MGDYIKSSIERQKTIFAFLKKRMKEKGIKQKDLVSLIGVSEPTLVRYFRLGNKMPLEVYLDILDVLGLQSCLSNIGDEMQSVFYFDSKK